MRLLKYFLVVSIFFYSCKNEKKEEKFSDKPNLIATNELKDIILASGKIIRIDSFA